MNYVGIDYKYLRMPGRNAGGYAFKPVIGEHYNGGEIYAAHRFTNDVGLSLGWEQSNKITNDYVFYNNQIFLNGTQPAGTSSHITNKIRALNFDVTGYYEITKRFEAVGGLGFALMQAYMTGIVTTGSTTSYNLNPEHNYQLIPRVSFSLQYFLIQNFGIRATLGWEFTNMYRAAMTDSTGVRGKIRPFQNSWTAAIGFVARF